MKEKPMQELLNFSIINIDKPTGPTSFTISDFVRKKIGLKKSSHFGTLDPMVTGILPIALGRACKLTGFFLGHDKEYVGIMHTHKDAELKNLQKLIDKNFLGKIKQLPPKKSRVKRELREREIKSFELIEQKEKNFLFRTEVQGGTYIRKLIHDLGEEIGGAHMAELRRVRAGIFSEPGVNLYDFEKAAEEFNLGNEENLRKILIPAEEAIKKIMPVVELVEENEVKNLLTGKPLFKKFLKNYENLEEGDIFALFFRDRFIEIAKVVNDGDIFAKSKFVFN